MNYSRRQSQRGEADLAALKAQAACSETFKPL
jgi:hypothetical protein